MGYFLGGEQVPRQGIDRGSVFFKIYWSWIILLAAFFRIAIICEDGSQICEITKYISVGGRFCIDGYRRACRKGSFPRRLVEYGGVWPKGRFGDAGIRA